MRNIIITDNTDTITLRNDLMFEIQPEEISKSVTMASGRLVKDVIGYKPVLKIPVGYLPLDDMTLLRNMIKRNNGLISISYPTPNGDVTQQFMVEQPTYTTFSYDENGVAVWQGVTIKGRALEVDV